MKAWRLFLGMLAGNVVGGSLCALATWLADIVRPNAVLVVYPSLVVIPLAIGLVAAWIWRPLHLSFGGTALHSLSCTLLGLGGAWLFLREGTICLLIVSPLLFVFVLAGALVGRVWFRPDRTKLNLCLLPLLALLAVREPLTRVEEPAVVSDEMLIHAPPQKVWPQVTSFPAITAVPHYWLFRLGLPRPMATTSAGDYVGAPRRCIFSGGAIFLEKVAELEPNKKLTFDILAQPPDPELIGHLTAQRGQFELRDNHDGTTTLIGRTWYVLHVRPLWYFDRWTRSIFRAVHLRVMENVREQAERAG